MENIKYTKDGKKVAVLGKINNTQWIVQEIYVSGNNEFPAGENFVVTSLLDIPAETYQSKEEKNIKQRLEKLNKEIEDRKKKLFIVSDKEKCFRHINMILKEYDSIDIKQLDTFLSFISGQITHVVYQRYSDFEILELSDILMAKDTYYSQPKYDGLRLLSLFGCAESGERYLNKEFSLNWMINQYRDGSGGWVTIIPVKSYNEAINILTDKLNSRLEEYSKKGVDNHGYHQSTIDCADKYGIPVDIKYRDELKEHKRKQAERLFNEANKKLIEAKENLELLNK